MKNWTKDIEDELVSILKDWLKKQGRTQQDLSKSLNAESSRMSALLEVLRKDFVSGGFKNVAASLCRIEESWAEEEFSPTSNKETVSENSTDPFDQLDLLLEEIRDTCKE